MLRRTGTRAVAGAAAAVVLAIPWGGVAVAQDVPETCRRVQLEQPLDWISSAVYLTHRGEIVVTSPTSPEDKKMHAFSQDGEHLWSHEGRDLPASIVPVPARMSAPGKRFIETSSWGELYFLGEDLRSRGEKVELAKIGSAADLELEAFFDRKITPDGWVVGYGSARAPDDGAPLFGFLAQSLAPLADGKEPFRLLLLSSSSELYYKLGNSYVATLGNDAYFLALERNPQLYRVSLGRDDFPERLHGLPGEDSFEVPVFEERELGYRADNVFGALQTFHGLPSGLFAQRGKLLVLYRPEADDAPWTLVTLRPGVDSVRVERRTSIPSRAPHLTAVPGPAVWTFFERSEVTEEGSQETTTLVQVPTSWILEPGLHPRGGCDRAGFEVARMVPEAKPKQT
ncbi:MAG: hypothetical protein MI919_14020 [Holophagales bacterium]|nr:hypothetical protein [Holophagales bacterium]